MAGRRLSCSLGWCREGTWAMPVTEMGTPWRVYTFSLLTLRVRVLREILRAEGRGREDHAERRGPGRLPLSPSLPPYLWIFWMQGRTKTRPPATMTGGLRQKPAEGGARTELGAGREPWARGTAASAGGALTRDHHGLVGAAREKHGSEGSCKTQAAPLRAVLRRPPPPRQACLDGLRTDSRLRPGSARLSPELAARSPSRRGLVRGRAAQRAPTTSTATAPRPAAPSCCSHGPPLPSKLRSGPPRPHLQPCPSPPPLAGPGALLLPAPRGASPGACCRIGPNRRRGRGSGAGRGSRRVGARKDSRRTLV